MFSVFKSNKPVAESNEKITNIRLVESYFGVCSEKCIMDPAKAFSDQEKVCLSKCLDRAHDYLMLA